jgi:protein CpxP
MKRKLILTAALATIAAAVVAYAASPAGGPGKDFHDGRHGDNFGMMMPGMMGPGRFDHMAEELGLSADQQARVKSIMENARPKMESIHADMRANAELLANTEPGDANYSNVVAKVRTAAADIAGRMVTEGSQVRADVWNVLTPEQRVKAKALRAQFRERMERRMEKHHRMMQERGDAAAPPPPSPPPPPPPPGN